ncbi:hypothetical protein ABPG75_004837 [Micractinium tetrahymenae]
MAALGRPPFGVVVKNEAEYAKRKTLDSLQVKAAPPKRARSDENAHADAFIDEMLERETRQCGAAPAPCAQQAGPTDFSGLFPKAGQHHVAAAGGGGMQPPAQQPGRAARTFEDLAAHRQSRHVLGDLLPGSNWLPDALPLHPDSSNHPSAAVAGAGGDRQLPASSSALLDWSLKTTVRFSSPTPFAIAEEAAFLPAGAVLAAQRACATCDAGLLSMQQRFLAALHSWQFPQNPGSGPGGGGAGAAARLRAPPPEVLARRRDWQAAFCSLYDALRSGACDAFYYLSPEGSKKPFAAFFGAAGVGGRPRLHALLTRSTAGLRALLSGGQGVGFAAPLLPADADRRIELDQSAVPLDGSQSLLVFEGALRVHGLFDLLVNESFRSHGDECDVPTLLAPAQFAHASLTAVQPKVLGVSDARDPGRAQHRLELRGAALPPWVLDRLAAILAVTQDGNFAMACDTHPLTLALNWCPSSSCGEAAADAGTAGGRRSSRRQPLGVQAAGPVARQLSDFEARQRGCWDGDEAARWRAAVPGLSCNVVRELHCEDGLFMGKLSAKSAERVVL